MREAKNESPEALERILARAYSGRSAPERGQVPPRPHLPARTDHVVHPDDGAAATPPLLEPPSAGVTLHWPSTIRTLERRYHDRFSRMADLVIEARDLRHVTALLFTSCHRAEGRTTLVLTLARALARRPGRTLLVDADLTGPMLARQLGLRPAVGLDDVVNEGAALADALVEAADDHLTILPLRAAIGHPREFLASPVWSATLADLRRQFDLVLLDGSPLFAGLSTAVPHWSVDAAVLVHSRMLTGERALLRAREVLDGQGIPLLGIAETFV